MKKEELMKLDGMTDALAVAVLNLAKGDTEGMIPKARLDEVIAERDKLAMLPTCATRSSRSKMLRRTRRRSTTQRFTRSRWTTL